ncbi:uncharacterized protein BDFB_004206 [Asbolus verrucosus]|uniref:Uncharacterized protein n=1 Tax=Asbolus verrucosus TaxID=1661398 RepID=A0A482W589_ASBVE|nr:uncharacterized protein BDFB_004206 [Asbolus verrucosus]
MAYSMFERPKLLNAKSMKFYPEEYDHHVSFRHKTMSPDFDLNIEKHTSISINSNKDQENYSVEAQTSTCSKKCPIYIHTFDKMHGQNEGDFVPKSERSRKFKNKHKLVMERLEESYWANWKPNKAGLKISKSPGISKNVPEIQVIKSAPERRCKIKVHPRPRDSQMENNYRIQKNPSKSQEIQTDDLPPIPKKDEEVDVVKEDVSKDETNDKETNNKEESCEKENIQVNSADDLVETKFLKHTDSFILNAKKQKEEKEHFEQPKCIRLYRKSGKTPSKNYVKGGSYPLKSCLKKESNATKGSKRLGRPGSPMIVSSSYSNKHGKSHRR